MRKIYMAVTVLLVLLFSLAVQPAALAQAGSGTYDDTNSLLSYSGSWSLGNSTAYANALAGTVHLTSDPNAAVSFTFTGSSITLFYTAAYNRGSMVVSISPGFTTYVNANLSETRRQVGKTWNVTPGVHTITVRPECACLIDVDAFSVNIATNGVNAYDDNASALSGRFIGSWTATTSASGAYLNTLHYSDTPGSVFRFTFTGNQIAYIFSRGPERGNALITIDGIDKGTVVQYSSDTSYPRQYDIVYRGLGPGIHILNITISANSFSASTGHRVDLDALQVPNCPGTTVPCRAYARTYLEFNNDYTAVSGYVNSTDPIIRDSTNNGAFSSEVFWIGQRRWSLGNPSYFEAGWRKEIGINGNIPFIYYGYYPYGGGFVGVPLTTAVPNFIWQYKIECIGGTGSSVASSACWHMYTSGVERTLSGIDIGVNAGSIRVGGEVTDASTTQHNAMGVSTFFSLTYKRNFGADTAWNGWHFQTQDYGYSLVTNNGTSFYNQGYN
jgi:hypothetical protein